MRPLFIVNPAAGHGRGRRRWEKAAGSLAGRWDAVFTQRPGHGALLARQALESGYDAVFAVGGDGTFGEVVDGFLSSPPRLRRGAAVGVWPAGSGCDFARHFGLRGAPGELAALSRARPTLIDAVVVSYLGRDGAPARRHFANVASFGLAGDVARGVEGSGKPLGGTAAYLWASFAAALMVPAREMDLIVDGKPLPPGRRHLVALANTSTTGGGMRIAPGADAADGELDVVIVDDMPRLSLLRRLPSVYRGSHLGASGVSLRRCRRLEARSSQEVPLNVDGELAGSLPAAFEVLPGALPLLLSAPA